MPRCAPGKPHPRRVKVFMCAAVSGCSRIPAAGGEGRGRLPWTNSTPARLLRPVSLPKPTKTLAEDWRKLWYEGGGVAHRGPLLPVHLAPRAGHWRCGTHAAIRRYNRFRANLTRGTRLDEIKNLHSLDSIATETYGTHGRLTQTLG